MPYPELEDRPVFAACLGAMATEVAGAVGALGAARIVPRIWARDHTVWRPAPTEIANRLGWLDAPVEMRRALPELAALRRAVAADGLTHGLLLGMGGSSLAPELFARSFPDAGGIRLTVVDTTEPTAVRDRTCEADPAGTLHIVATKSGGTVETFSLMRYCYNRVAAAVGPTGAGRRFMAITDPGSALADLAARLSFRATLLNNPDIGGRFAALSQFGLAPAALVGVDVAGLLERADAMAEACGPDVPVEGNPAALLGATLAVCARAGRDKLTLVVSSALPGLAEWIEQLVAESTGKDGVGIVPVVGEPLVPPARYGDDRLFVHVRLAGGDDAEAADGDALEALAGAGHPVVGLTVAGRADLGGQFLLWEMATAIAGHCLGIQPFDQPDVESAKAGAREAVAAFRSSGALPADVPDFVVDGVSVFGVAAFATGADGAPSFADPASGVTSSAAPASGAPAAGPSSALGSVAPASGAPASGAPAPPVTPADALAGFLTGMAPGAGRYVALQAFVAPSAATDRALGHLREAIRAASGVAVTLGYGPRFLHSTGQLHKGDDGGGRFVQITCDPAVEVAIPDEAGRPESALSFGTLIAAQALGDRRALAHAGRPVLRLHLAGDVPGRLRALAEALAARAVAAA